jgi:hypothetical protein
MTARFLTSDLDRRAKIRNVVFVLAGLALFVLKRQYAGPLQEIVQAYAGNLSVSFALYFVFMNLELRPAVRKPAAALLALAAVESFELFNGYGVMVNTYDPLDLVVNAIGVLFAWSLDSLLSRGDAGQRGAKTMNTGSTTP